MKRVGLILTIALVFVGTKALPELHLSEKKTSRTSVSQAPTTTKAADTCGQYAATSAAAAKAEVEDRPNGADDMEFTDEGRTIVLLPGQHCVREDGLTASVSASGEIYEGVAPSTPTVTTTQQQQQQPTKGVETEERERQNGTYCHNHDEGCGGAHCHQCESQREVQEQSE